jgi:predicted transcriptional regulator
LDGNPGSKGRIMAEGSGATSNVVGLSADIVAAYVTKNHIQKDELPALIATVHEAVRL